MPTPALNIHCLQHVPFEGLGEISPWIQQRGHALSFTRFFENAAPPEPESVDFLVVMGGPMNVYEYRLYPWLRTEKRFIERLIQRGTPVLGICLGAQLVADVLGAKVYQNAEKEIGWFPIRWRSTPETRSLLGGDPGQTTAFHWHGDTFDLPTGAAWLAENDGCPNQAFCFRERVVGLQFHLEVGPKEVATMVEHGGHELTGGRFIQSRAELLRAPTSLAACHSLLWTLLDRLCQPT